MGITMVDTSVFGGLNRVNSAKEIANDLHELAASGETLMVGASAHREILKTPDATLRNAQLSQIKDFKMQIQTDATAAEHTIGEDFANRLVDEKKGKINYKQLGLEIKDLAIGSDVKVQMARTPTQKVTLFTIERMVRNKITITRNFGIEFSERARVVINMGPYHAYEPHNLGIKSAPAAPPAQSKVGLVKKGAGTPDSDPPVGGGLPPGGSNTRPSGGRGGRSSSGGRVPSSRIGAPGVGLFSGIIHGAMILTQIAVNNWLVENVISSKWAAERRVMLENAIEAARPWLNVLILSKSWNIRQAKARGEDVTLHLVVDSQWMETDQGPAQMKVVVSEYSLLFKGDAPVDFPIFRDVQMTKIKRPYWRRQFIDIPL